MGKNRRNNRRRGGRKMKKILLRLPEKTHEELKELAAQRGKTVTRLIQTAIEEWLERENGGENE